MVFMSRGSATATSNTWSSGPLRRDLRVLPPCPAARLRAHLSRYPAEPGGLDEGVYRDGELALGNWQSVILAELDGPRDRAIQVQVMGVSEKASSTEEPPR
jgi:hypothetical protein